MISWKELEGVLSATSTASCRYALKKLVLQTSPEEVEHFPILAGAKAPASAPAAAVPSVPAALPPPSVKNSVDVPVAVATTVKPVKAPVASKTPIDPIVLGIELGEPLYVGAPHSTRHILEMEAAQKLEAQLDNLYKSCSGRSRGWTKVGLEGMIKPRCASGGDLKEIDRAKKAFLWAVVTEDKAMSAFLDFVCCARRIRCVVWDETKKTAYLYPAADIQTLEEDAKEKTYPLYVVDKTGHPMYGIGSAAELLKFVDKEHWTLLPPASVTHTLSGLKLEELESVGKRLGMSSVEGKKTDRITAIATFKTRRRLAMV